jgi:hypothetical protein
VFIVILKFSLKEKKKQSEKGAVFPALNLVPKMGLEPTRINSHAPETCASTNSATSVIKDFKIRGNFYQLKAGRIVFVYSGFL